MTIPKKIIDKNIKNSTITRRINNAITRPILKLPIITVDSKSLRESKNVGETNKIKIDVIKLVNPQSISIKAVIYFELISCDFVTGKV